MATSPDTIAFFLEQLEGRGVTARKMFGEYGIYAGGKIVALICDDTLFVKQLPEARSYLGTPDEAPPYKGAKPHYAISADQWEDADWLWGLISLMETHLHLPKPKARKRKG